MEKTGFDLLESFSSGYGSVVLFAGPLALIAFVAIVVGVIVIRRRRIERRELEAAIIVSPSLPTSGEASQEKVEAPQSESLSPSRQEQAEAKTETKAVDLGSDDVRDIRSSEKSQSWLARLRSSLAKTSAVFGSGLRGLFTGKVKIDEELLERIHEQLYRADLGVKTVDQLTNALRTDLLGREDVTWAVVRECLEGQIAKIFAKSNKPLVQPAQGPLVILVVGVNGVGKTTTIGKLAARFLAENKKVLLAAGDTFRAAAIEQLEVWGRRLNVDVIRQQQGSDPAAVAYDACKAAVARGADVLLIDTAGRLHNKTELMDELAKIYRVLSRDIPGAPHETWLVIDSTTGQNAVMQVKAFKEVSQVSGLIATKLDGTAKGGVLIGIADQFELPIRFIGVGEKASDLQIFSPKEFASALFGEG